MALSTIAVVRRHKTKTMCGKNTTLALTFLGVIISFCGLGDGAAEVVQRNIAANKIPGFISIDCGAPSEYLDDIGQIWYETDSGYIDSGENMLVPSEVPPFEVTNRKDIYTVAMNLRSFTYGMRNCYTLRPNKGANQTYLIRASFLYGNYDGKNQIPIFDLYIGVNKWATVLLQGIFSLRIHEVSIVAPEGDVQVCLVNTGRGTPFINGLELRTFENALYQPSSSSSALTVRGRSDIGAQTAQLPVPVVRHPDDDYDRLWVGQMTEWLPVSNSSNFNIYGKSDFYKVPIRVLMTAVGSPNTSIPLTHTFNMGDGVNSRWHMYLHFAEIQRHEDGLKRKLRVSTNTGTTQPIILEYAKPMTLLLPLRGGVVNFSIYADDGSMLPPIVNAIELYQVIDLPNTPTLLADVDAITNIKQSYAVSKNWQGDPCVPKDYAWEGINCTYSIPSRIVSLNMSFCNLKGEISASFSKLHGIQTMDLSYNNLSGPLPEFLGDLPSLKILYLMGNNLTGPIPPSIRNKFQDGELVLRLAGNPLCQTYQCEGDEKRTKRRSIVPLVTSILSTAVILITVCALVFFWGIRRRDDGIKNNQGLIELRNRPFGYNEVLQITENLNTVIGEGGFGKVYLGRLTNGTRVAVKLLSETSKQGHKEFQAEVQLLMVIHHKNLASLVGYCHEGGNMALIYEYMANGSLKHYLSGTSERNPYSILRLSTYLLEFGVFKRG